MLLNKTIAFIGAGRMAEAVITGLLTSNTTTADKIIVSDINKERLEYLNKRLCISAVDNDNAVSIADIIVLSVKPQTMRSVLNEIKESKKTNKLFISIAAGISVKFLEQNLSMARVIRVMPNNPCLIGKGMSVISRGAQSTNEDVDYKILITSR